MGNVIHDEDKRESKHGTIEGLGLLDIESSFSRAGKIVTQSEAIIPDNLEGLAAEIFNNIDGESVTGYEIDPDRREASIDLLISDGSHVTGTYRMSDHSFSYRMN